MTPQPSPSEASTPDSPLGCLEIKVVMTPAPVTIDEDADLFTARRLLRDQKVRHLPVTRNGKLTGILSERDTRLVMLLPEIVKIAVADVMSRKPLTVQEDCTAIEAISKMAARKYGCLVVTKPNGEISGIFTNQDALRLLLGEPGSRGSLSSNCPSPDDDDLDEDCW